MCSLVATALRRIDPSVLHVRAARWGRSPDAPAPNVVATYGMTETGSGVVYDGCPLEGVEVSLRSAALVEPDGRPTQKARSWSARPC